jgi:hypothetical protein
MARLQIFTLRCPWISISHTTASVQLTTHKAVRGHQFHGYGTQSNTVSRIQM